MKILETERLVLRKMMPGDAAFMLELLNDPGFIKFIGDRGVRSNEDAERYIRTGPTATYDTRGYGYYIVELKETGAPIGTCGLRTRDGLDDVDLGYAFLEAHRGRGYAAEAAGALLRYAHDVLGMQRVAAICSPDNHASVAVLQKAGFAYEKLVRLPGEASDVKLFVATNGDVA